MTMLWEIDEANSQVSFAIRVMSVTTTRGCFHALRGHLHIDEQDPANSWVEAEIEAASIDTHNRLRDAHLRSNAFLAVKQYPTIAFRSTHVEHTGGSGYTVTGNLTLLGTTRPITFAVDYRGQSTESNAHASLTARATMNRDDFGLGRGMMIQFVAGKTVTIDISLVTFHTADNETVKEAKAENPTSALPGWGA
jgi:polyisoprenoid-binding protein YceI